MSYAPMESEAVSKNSQSNFHSSSFQSRSSSSLATKRSPRKNGHFPKWDGSRNFPIIVHSHLCWDWVWQRPQQFLSRLSQKHKILFVETIAPDPELAAPLARIRNVPEYPRITILRMQFPQWRWHDGNHIDLER